MVTIVSAADPVVVDEGKPARFVEKKKRQYSLDTKKLEAEHERRCGPVPVEKPIVEGPGPSVVEYSLEQVIPDGGNNVNPFDFVSLLAFLEGDRDTPEATPSEAPAPVAGSCSGVPFSSVGPPVVSTTKRVCVFIDQDFFPSVAIHMTPSGGGPTISFLIFVDPPDFTQIKIIQTGIVTTSLEPPSLSVLRPATDGTTTHQILVHTKGPHTYCLNLQIAKSGDTLTVTTVKAVIVQ